MRIIVRVFLASFLSLALVVVLARLGSPECLRLAGYQMVQITDLGAGRTFPTEPAPMRDQYFSTTSPDNALTGYFQRRRLPSGDSTFDYWVSAIDENGYPIGVPRMIYRDLPEPLLAGSSYLRDVVNAVWLPDSRHLLLYWLPDYQLFFNGTRSQHMSITQSIHKFVLIDLNGNIILQHTLPLTLFTQDMQPGSPLWPFHSYIVEGVSHDGKVLVMRHEEATSDTFEMWSLSDFQPIAPPIDRYEGGCYSPYESSAEYCVNWTPQGDALTVIGRQPDGSPMIVVHDFATGQRHTIPLPAAPYQSFLIMPWSPDGKHDIVSWFYAGHSTQLMFDRAGNKLGILSNGTLTGLVDVPQHRWTADGDGILYYSWEESGFIGKLFLGDSQRQITLPGYVINDPWFTDEAQRGSQIALLWNEANPDKSTDKPNVVRVGVINTRTGLVTILHTFNDLWLGEGEPVWVHWRSDTRLAVATNYGFAWGNTDGSDWRETAEVVSVYPATFTRDGKSVLVVKPTEGQGSVYELDLATAAVRPIMTSTASSRTMTVLERSPNDRFIYRLMADSAGATDLQVMDTYTAREYTIANAPKPLWSPDDQQFLLMADDGKLRVLSAATGDVRHERSRVPVSLISPFLNASFGRCS